MTRGIWASVVIRHPSLNDAGVCKTLGLAVDDVIKRDFAQLARDVEVKINILRK